MTDEERENVCDRVDNEGFDYTFLHYSHFEEIADPEFHRLRKEFIKATEKLADYIGYEA